jgi:predicted ATPase/DNA-binding SARP family transcriptional activator
MLEIRLLGEPEFAFEGAPFRFAAPPRALPLLAWLLLHRRAPLSRDSVAFTFWPDALEEDARGDLRRHLYYLTKALPAPSGEPWVLADKKTIAWNERAPATFDVLDFERLCADEASLEEAVRLYRGPLLTGVDDEWIEPERERLRNLAENALRRLIERERERDPARAIGYAQALLRVDPWREDALRDLIALRHRSGDRAGALREYRDFATRLRRELDVAPMPETTAVFERVAGSDAPQPVRAAAAPPSAPPTNLPERSDPLIGRARALLEVRTLLENTRVATLAGTGGVGKTRLAVEAGWEVLADFPDGVWFADCGPLVDATPVLATIAAATGVAQANERPELAAVVAALRRRKLLLIVDNCEHVVAEVARIVSELIAGAPGLRVLASSREPLAVRGERVFRVPSLDLPPAFESQSPQAARAYGAVALFETRASAADSGFALDSDNVADVIEICRRLDGIAFAIELAAARVSLLEPRELARRLEERFRVLTGGERTALPRQRTMRASIDWSWELCSDAERTLLQRLAVFPGSWTLEAAEAIAFFAPLDPQSGIECSAALVEKSLLIADGASHGRRYRLLESIRDYALEKLEAAGEAATCRVRHAAYYADFAARVDADCEAASDPVWYAAAGSELDNVRAALAWSFGGAGDPLLGARLACAYGPLWRYGTQRGDRRWLDLAYERLDRTADHALTARLQWQIAALEHADYRHAHWAAVAVRDRGDERTKAEAFCWVAEIDRRAGRLDEAAASLAEAAPFADPLRRPKAYASYVLGSGRLAAARGDLEEARRSLERAVATGAACGAIAVVTEARVALAEAAFAANDLPRALAAARAARETSAEVFGRTVALAAAGAQVAAYELATGDLENAGRSAREALEIAVDFGVPEHFLGAVETLAVVAAERGDPERAAFLLGFAEAERTRRDETCGTLEAAVRARLLEVLGSASASEARRRGSIAGIDRGVGEALASLGHARELA